MVLYLSFKHAVVTPLIKKPGLDSVSVGLVQYCWFSIVVLSFFHFGQLAKANLFFHSITLRFYSMRLIQYLDKCNALYVGLSQSYLPSS